MVDPVISKRNQANKARGRGAEKDVEDWLNERGYVVERRRLKGGKDMGDIVGLPNAIVEVKDHAKMVLPVWLDETETERKNAEVDHGFLIVKRRRVGDVGRWYMIHEVQDGFRLYEKAMRND